MRCALPLRGAMPRLSCTVTCASDVLQRHAFCTPAGRTALPSSSSACAQCAGRRTMLEQHQLQVQSCCLRVTAEEQNMPADRLARPAPRWRL